MKKKFGSKSAFFNLRFLLGFFLCLGGTFMALVAFSLYSAPSALAQKPKQTSRISAAPKVIPMVGPISQDQNLRNLPYYPANKEVEETRLKRHPQFKSTGKKDPVLQAVRRAAEVVAMPTPVATYPGITSGQGGCGCLPPDTQGDVGPNHYIQAVNSSIKILDKSGNQLLAPTTYNSFFCSDGPAYSLRRESEQGRRLCLLRSFG